MQKFHFLLFVLKQSYTYYHVICMAVPITSDSHLPKNRVIWFIESPLNMIKNAFYFTLKALFFLKILKFLSWLFARVKIGKIGLISKLMTPQTCQQTIVIDIFLIISRSKGNQTMSSPQLDLKLALNLAYNKNKLYKTFKLLIQRYAQFWFFGKGSGIVSPPDFVYDFSRKICLMLYFIN